jgi:hypothetical protein
MLRSIKANLRVVAVTLIAVLVTMREQISRIVTPTKPLVAVPGPGNPGPADAEPRIGLDSSDAEVLAVLAEDLLPDAQIFPNLPRCSAGVRMDNRGSVSDPSYWRG